MAKISVGMPTPLGASPVAGGVNFSLLSRHATSVELLLFAGPDATEPAEVVPVTGRTLDYWHVEVADVPMGTPYAWRVDGPSRSAGGGRRGARFDRTKALIDPYALANSDALYVEADSCGPGANVATAMRSLVVDPTGYDWEGDRPPRTPWADTVIYELHVRGFTRSPTSGCRHPGTFDALIGKLPYIRDLGVTAIELMPVAQFDSRRIIRRSPTTGEQLRNFWGYDPVAFLAPHAPYCVAPSGARQLDEFRDLVKAAHRLGLEVILDVVFNHTGERDEHGPTLSFRGIDNAVYYMVAGEDGAGYLDFTGCQNTVNGAHPATAQLIRDALVHWTETMHVDGFRFDLASVLTLSEDGNPMPYPPTLWATRLDPRLADVKLIAEPFGKIDTASSFPDARFATWNYLAKNTIRRFVRGDRGLVGDLATRIAGSSDLYEDQGKTPLNGITYVTCHDGMTLNDVVSYSRSHNEANGEESGFGEVSANYGAEGPDPRLDALRLRQVKNHLTILMLCQGVPMLLAGDECRRTQGGNNNPYLQDNATSWFDWTRPLNERDLVAFVRGLLDFRRRHPELRRDAFLTGRPGNDGLRDVAWHGCDLDRPGFGDPASRVLSFTLARGGSGQDIHAILNMDDQSLSFELPPLGGRAWHKAIDTSLGHPDDAAPSGGEPAVTGARIAVGDRTAVVLVSR